MSKQIHIVLNNDQAGTFDRAKTIFDLLVKDGKIVMTEEDTPHSRTGVTQGGFVKYLAKYWLDALTIKENEAIAKALKNILVENVSETPVARFKETR